MQKKVLLSSILVIALCFSVIAGSTYALFTDSAENSIMITAGDVEVDAKLAITDVWSAKAKANQKETQDDIFLVDEYGHKYDHVKPGKGEWVFTNGGEAVLSQNVITVTNITPGDKLDVALTVDNLGNVDMIYRYEIVANDGALAMGMVLTVEDAYYEATKSYTSAWSGVVAQADAPITHNFSLELPVRANNDYENKTVEYTITVYAVQGNAAVPTAQAMPTVEFVDGANIDLLGRILSDKAGIINTGDVAISNGAIAIEKVGFENYGSAELNDIVFDAGAPGYISYGYGIIGQAGSETVLNNVTLNSANGAIGALDGAHVVINSGNYEVDSANTSARYHVYAVGEGTLVEINGGNFDFNKTQNQKRAYAYVGAGATLVINGGTFGTASSRSGYTAGLLGEGTIIITGGTFGFDPTAWVADGCKVVKEGKQWTVVPVELGDVKDALANGEDATLGSDLSVNDKADYDSNGYGKTALNVNGQTFDGNGNTLSAPHSNGTWDSAISTNGGTIKNLTIDSGFRGIFVKGGTKVYLENVVIDGSVYTISCDSANNSGLEATNSTFNGWTSYAATIGDVKFVDCSFGYGAGYAFCRPYAPTEFVNCEFEAGYKIDARAAVTFENCTIAGEPLTAENLATLVTSNIANASVK